MNTFGPWIIGILTGIIVSSLEQNNRFFKIFLISSILIFLFNFFDFESRYNNNAEEQHNLGYMIGESIGGGLVVGSLGYLIGNYLFKKEKAE